jgi:hypothetical protein
LNPESKTAFEMQAIVLIMANVTKELVAARLCILATWQKECAEALILMTSVEATIASGNEETQTQ